MNISKFTTIEIVLKTNILKSLFNFFERKAVLFITLFLTGISIAFFLVFISDGLALAYNDARSHLDIGRRVVEGLKPGLAQLGSVWLPLNHILMIPTIWNDFMWHTGLSGAIVSMISYVATGVLIYLILKHLNVSFLGRIIGVLVFALNLNILYLQSTAMTELLLIATSTAGAYYLILWFENQRIIDLLKTAFWLMMATLTRYDGWFLFLITAILIVIHGYRKKGYKGAEGLFFLFCTLGGLGIILWFLWNQLIFGDALYFALGPYSAHAQQQQLDQAGNLITKNNWWISTQTYFYALFYNSNTFISLLSFFGGAVFWLDKRVSLNNKLASIALLGPLFFNILALYLGFSVLFIQGINGDTWFNVRYGVMLMPFIAVFTGYLVHKLDNLKIVLIGLLILVTFFQFNSFDAATIDDARVGSSQKNVSEVSGYIKEHATGQKGFILISAASHDAIIFSSGLPMDRFIHEGTGEYWKAATGSPDRWARWIVTRTYDDNDSTWRLIKNSDGLSRYRLVAKYPFADIYELKEEFLNDLNTEAIFVNQK